MTEARLADLLARFARAADATMGARVELLKAQMLDEIRAEMGLTCLAPAEDGADLEPCCALPPTDSEGGE